MSARHVFMLSVWMMVLIVPIHHVTGQTRSAKAPEDVFIAWEHDFSSTDGWIDNAIDPIIGTTLSLETGNQVMIVQQSGKDAWGKTAILVENVDLGAASVLEAVVTKVDKGCGFKVGIAPTDWSDFIEVLKRSSADGAHKGDIEKAVKRAGRKDLLSGPASFYIVIVVEGRGKSAYFDHLQIRSGN